MLRETKLGLMLCCYCLEIVNNFWARGPTFLFTLYANYIVSPSKSFFISIHFARNQVRLRDRHRGTEQRVETTLLWKFQFSSPCLQSSLEELLMLLRILALFFPWRKEKAGFSENKWFKLADCKGEGWECMWRRDCWWKSGETWKMPFGGLKTWGDARSQRQPLNPLVLGELGKEVLQRNSFSALISLWSWPLLLNLEARLV